MITSVSPDSYISTQAADTMERLSWETLDYLTRILGRPTEGNIPWAIWRKSNTVASGQASDAMHRMGYKPWQGYPLQIDGQRPAEMEAIHQALETAYDEIRRGMSDDTGPNPILIDADKKELEEPQ